MNDRFAGHVVITGGLGGLGSAVVEAFAVAGATCHLPVLEPPRGPLPGPAGQVHTAVVDLTDESAVARFYDSVPALTASVHLAGGFHGGPITETTRADLERLVSLNLITTFLCCREAVRRMRSHGGGRIVNVGARVSEVAVGKLAAYTATKAAVAGLTRSLAEEVRAEGIQVNAVLPSIIDTPGNRAAMPNADFSAWPKPAEIAAAILWLASPANALVSGALVPVSGRAG
ncbi:MAG: SDR family NAD(P)-dependent oxidoreductase [Gemmatimonadales bacterium]